MPKYEGTVTFTATYDNVEANNASAAEDIIREYAKEDFDPFVNVEEMI